MVQILAIGLFPSADNATEAITVLPEMPQLSPDRARKDITVHMETSLHSLSHRLQVSKCLYTNALQNHTFTVTDPRCCFANVFVNLVVIIY